MAMNKQYLGDAVYAELEDWGDLVLTTEDGIRTTNRIVLEPSVILALDGYLKWIRDLRERVEKGAKDGSE